MAESDIRHAAARADLWRLLAACYYQPAPEFLEEDVFGAMRTAGRELDPRLAQLADSLDREFRQHALEALLVDYTRLFLNPSGALAAPYESAWLAGSDPVLRQQSMDAVVAAYADGGFEISEEFRDLPDHIAAELEFMYSLSFREASALMAERSDGDASTRRRQAFLQNHLGKWIVPFTDAIRASAQTDFYRALAQLTLHFVAGKS